MFERLMARGERIAAARKRQAIARLAERLGEDVPPGVEAEPGEEGLILSGRRLWRRWLSDARLHAIGLLAKENGR